MFTIPDFIVLALLVLSSIAIGIYQSMTGGKQRTRREFILNNRQLKILPTVLSYTVSYQSAISVLGGTAEIYEWGAPLWLAGELCMALGMVVFERLALPTFYNIGVMSIYEYFELRFGNGVVKRFVSIIGMFRSTVYMAVTVLGPSIALEMMAGIPLEVGIYTLGICCALYTSLGGIRAIIWTDVIQCVVMVTGLLVIFASATLEVGGITNLFGIGRDFGRLNYADLNPSFYKRITAPIGLPAFCFLGMFAYGFEQASYQRYASMPSLTKARVVLWLMVPFHLLYISLCYMVGVSVFGYFASKGCDPLLSGEISQSNQLLPYFVSIYFDNRPGGKGLFLAVLFGASLSSVSSVLGGCAANLWEDHLKSFFPVSQLQTIPVDQCPPNITLTDHSNSTRELAGIERLYGISFVWYTPISTLITIVVGLCASEIFKLIIKQSAAEVDDKYVVSWRNIISFGNQGAEKTRQEKCGDEELSADDVTAVMAPLTIQTKLFDAE